MKTTPTALLLLAAFDFVLFTKRVDSLPSDATESKQNKDDDNWRGVKVVATPFRVGSQTMKAELTDMGFIPFGMGDCISLYSCLLSIHDRVRTGKLIDWKGLLAGRYDATVGVPAAAFIEEFLDSNPETKVVLLTRDPDKYYKSWDRNRRLFSWLDSQPLIMFLVPRLRVIVRSAVMPMLFEHFFEGKPSDKEHCKDVFVRNLESVRRIVPKERLLEMSIADPNGREILADFLGVNKVVDAATEEKLFHGPFRKANSKQADEAKYHMFRAVLKDFVLFLLAVQLYRWAGLTAVVAELALLIGLYNTWQF